MNLLIKIRPIFNLFVAQVVVIKGHDGLVKGVTWDPVGKYLASQVKSFKKSVKKLNYMAVNKNYKTILDNSESETHILHVGYSLW